MQTAVAVWLGRGDVVARLYQPDIILSGEQLADGVGIVEVGANHADARNVVQIVHCRLRVMGSPLRLSFWAMLCGLLIRLSI